jgi:hypothetical protein
MNMILNWFKTFKGTTKNNNPKEQVAIEMKRQKSTVEFIFPGHPLYDNIVTQEKNQLRILAPNETAYDETSLIHNFVAIVTNEENNYIVVNSSRHFKEQSIGGLLQFDENIYNVIPFFEDDTEYQTANAFTYSETYEYDHPVQTYGFTAEHNGKAIGINYENGKKPLTVDMIDKLRPLFSSHLNEENIFLIDCAVIPALNAYTLIQEKRKSAS